MMSTLSYLSKPMTRDYIYQSLPDRLRLLAEEDGDREAFVFYDQNWKRSTISRKELLDQSISLAKSLVGIGLKRYASVGFCMSNSINNLLANMAVVCAGGIPFFTSINLKDGSDLIETLNSMKCEMVVIDTNGDDANWQILEKIWPISSNESDKVPTLKTIICNGNIPEKITNRLALDIIMMKSPAADTKLPEIQPEDVLLHFSTSGSTGSPKQVVNTHYSLFNYTKQCDITLGITAESRYFCDRTLSWPVGYPRVYLMEGLTRIFVDPKLTLSGQMVEKITDIIQAEKCDVMYVPGYIAIDLLNNPHLSTKLTNVKTMIVGGERVPAAFSALKDTFCKSLYIMYGSTEAGLATTYTGDRRGDYEDGIVGKPLSGMELKIVDETGAVVPRGVSGELLMRSTWRFVGYHNMETEFRKAVDQSDWFHSGDIAHIREDGNVVIDGRQKEVISMQTNKIFPWAIEQTLKKMSGVQFAFAVGVPDKRLYEVICACIVPKDDVSLTADNVRKYCDDVFLQESTSMVVTIKPVYYVILEAVPLTSTGKIDRVRVSAIAREQLGL